MSKINLHDATMKARRQSLATLISIAVNNLINEFGEKNWTYEGQVELEDQIVMSFSLGNRQKFNVTIKEWF